MPYFLSLLALPLFVPRIDADNTHDTTPLDDLALVTDLPH